MNVACQKWTYPASALHAHRRHHAVITPVELAGQWLHFGGAAATCQLTTLSTVLH